MNPVISLIIFVILLVGAVLAVVFYLIIPLVRLIQSKIDPNVIFYWKIKSIAYSHDCYLVNDFTMVQDGKETFHIDHILFGRKYIYVIRDRFYSGAISGKYNDKSWINHVSKNRSNYIANPMALNNDRKGLLAAHMGLNPDFLVSIVVHNDECYLSPIESTDDKNVIVPLSKLAKTVRSFEKRDIGDLNPQSLAMAARDIARLNENGKKQ